MSFRIQPDQFTVSTEFNVENLQLSPQNVILTVLSLIDLLSANTIQINLPINIYLTEHQYHRTMDSLHFCFIDSCRYLRVDIPSHPYQTTHSGHYGHRTDTASNLYWFLIKILTTARKLSINGTDCRQSVASFMIMI